MTVKGGGIPEVKEVWTVSPDVTIYLYENDLILVQLGHGREAEFVSHWPPRPESPEG